MLVQRIKIPTQNVLFTGKEQRASLYRDCTARKTRCTLHCMVANHPPGLQRKNRKFLPKYANKESVHRKNQKNSVLT